MSSRINGKSAIVTGAGSGINLEFTRLLLQEGVNVLFADLALRPEAEELLNSYQSKPRAVFVKTDVTVWRDLEEMFKVAEEEFHTVDIVCPGAGVFEPPFSNFWHPPGTSQSTDDPTSNHYKTLEINLTHPIRTTQLAISHFLASSPPPSASNRKCVVNVASIAGETSSLPFPLYHASKHALVGFVRSMGLLDTEFGIRITGVMPGMVKTPLWLDNPEKLRMINQETDIWITPQEVAQAMLALVKDDFIPAEMAGSSKDLPIAGGELFRVVAKRIQSVPAFNNPGPLVDKLPGSGASNAADVLQDVLTTIKTEWSPQNAK